MPDFYTSVTFADSGPHDPDRLVDLTATLGGNCLADANARTLTVSRLVKAYSLADAAKAAQLSDMPWLGTPVAVDVATDQHHLDRIAGPDMPGAMTLTDIGRRIGVARQQVQRLSKTDPDFPRPVAHPATGPIFWAPDVERYAAVYQPRGRGRPRKQPVAS